MQTLKHLKSGSRLAAPCITYHGMLQDLHAVYTLHQRRPARVQVFAIPFGAAAVAMALLGMSRLASNDATTAWNTADDLLSYATNITNSTNTVFGAANSIIGNITAIQMLYDEYVNLPVLTANISCVSTLLDNVNPAMVQSTALNFTSYVNATLLPGLAAFNVRLHTLAPFSALSSLLMTTFTLSKRPPA
jgi:hypothetical protein